MAVAVSRLFVAKLSSGNRYSSLQLRAAVRAVGAGEVADLGQQRPTELIPAGQESRQARRIDEAVPIQPSVFTIVKSGSPALMFRLSTDEPPVISVCR